MQQILFKDLDFKMEIVSNLERMYQLSDDFQKNGTYSVTGRIYGHLNEEILNPEFQSLLRSLGVDLKPTFEVFQTPPNSFANIHTDNTKYTTDSVGDIVKLNFVFGGKGSKMGWWKEKPGITNTCEAVTSRVRPLRHPHMSYYPDEVDLIAEHEIKFPTLVQVGPPHNIWTGDEQRYCLCLIPIWPDTGIRLTMPEALEVFKDYLVH
jgi:hypothetical protein